MKQFTSLLLAFVLVLSLFGCSNAPETQTTEPSATETTAETETTEATEPAIDTEEKLNTALQLSSYVELDASLELEKSVVVHAGELNGNGNTLTGPQYVEDSVNTENAIAIQKGKISNITLKDAYRCIGDTKANPQIGDIYLENVTVDGPTYALNFGQGGYTDQLIVDDSNLYGWSSYTGISTALFTNCTFGWDSTGANGNLRPYVDTVLTNCKFEGKTEEDGTVTPFNINLKESISGITITFEDCYVGDTLITEENINELLNVAVYNNTIRFSNTEA